MEFGSEFYNCQLNDRVKKTVKYKLKKICFIFYYQFKYKHISLLKFEEAF